MVACFHKDGIIKAKGTNNRNKVNNLLIKKSINYFRSSLFFSFFIFKITFLRRQTIRTIREL